MISPKVICKRDRTLRYSQKFSSMISVALYIGWFSVVNSRIMLFNYMCTTLRYYYQTVYSRRLHELAEQCRIILSSYTNSVIKRYKDATVKLSASQLCLNALPPGYHIQDSGLLHVLLFYFSAYNFTIIIYIFMCTFIILNTPFATQNFDCNFCLCCTCM